MKTAAAILLAAMTTGAEGKRLIDFGNGTKRWMTSEEVDVLASEPGRLGGFIDITGRSNYTYEAYAAKRKANIPFPKPGDHEGFVNDIISQMKSSDITDTISMLGTFHTRYYTSQFGVDAVARLAAMYRQTASVRSDIQVQEYLHSWAQPSLIATIEGSGPRKHETVIIGGHIDSINGATGRAPGEDDDGSGSATVYAIFNHLVNNQFKPDRTVEFHAYAAEEVGLRGSQDIAQYYDSIGRNIVAMLQLDCTGYTKGSSVARIGIVTDNTNSQLNQFIREVISTYGNAAYTDTQCGYGCSDHASFDRYGFPASFPFESPFPERNPYMHTTNDVLSHLNETHMLEFAKLGVGFVADLACAEDIESCT
eukprot:TRINITY_DN812_c4_g1_i1.p1 TRINITY_DN812_c4_g1~~TRINITY_DN812_c4_g1_i1.p1  ORF type:complete len:366 (+),score=80.92 TRINITY_DN812_c4_g1_i1:155-1252(+)